MKADRGASVRDVCSLKKIKLQLFLLNLLVVSLDLLLILLRSSLDFLHNGLIYAVEFVEAGDEAV